MSELLAIGKLADATGVSVSTLRYYDEIGLVAPSKRVGGKRRFQPDAVGRANFIRRARGVGFSLEEIADILDDSDGAWGKMVELRSQRKELEVMITMLEEVRACGCRVVAECPRLGDEC